MELDEVFEYYSRPQVAEEITKYCRGRWVAIECLKTAEAQRLFVRYWKRGGAPLTISSPDELVGALKRFKGLWPRSIYATLNVYRRIEEASDPEDPSNIAYTTPVWDIDGSLEEWGLIVEAAEAILSVLEEEGVSKSVYLKWSGRGMHIHVHEKAFSQEVLSKHNPLDIAYSVVEYVLRRAEGRLREVIAKSRDEERPLKVENEVDPKRVFTAPLSLHRLLDSCCVCLKPNQLSDFSPDWADPHAFKHSSDWVFCEEGEADSLAIEAFSRVKGYPGWPGVEKPTTAIRTVVARPTEPKRVEQKLGRFQVMALLQAARYFLLTENLDMAKSFGLNRAIFYAWAKRRPRERVPPRRIPLEKKEVAEEEREGRKMVYVGNEGAFVSPRGWFVIGDTEQTPKDYDRQIARRIDAVIPYEEAWEAALEYLRSQPKQYLLDQQKFFSKVYEPVRDKFIEVVVKKLGKQQTFDQFLK